MTEIRYLSDLSDFQTSVVDSEGPVLLGFSADWCAPCAWLDPYLLDLLPTGDAGGGADGEPGEGPGGDPDGGADLVILKADVDVLPELAQRFRVASVPTVILFLSGAEAGRSLGIEPERLRAMAAQASAWAASQ